MNSPNDKKQNEQAIEFAAQYPKEYIRLHTLKGKKIKSVKDQTEIMELECLKRRSCPHQQSQTSLQAPMTIEWLEKMIPALPVLRVSK